ncbi:MAG: tetratricopeptide repeat protein, partial [Candidatus Methanofastidiosia archaeon]
MDEMEQIIVQIAETYKKPDEFIYNLKKSFKIPPNEKGNFFLQVGVILYKFSYFHLALHIWDHALKCFTEEHDREGELRCRINLGNVYSRLGDLKRAIEYHKESLERTKELGDRYGETACYMNLGIVYCRLGNFKKAISCYEKSLEIDRELGDRYG